MYKEGVTFSAAKIDMAAWDIGEAFLKGILLEVSAYPKPGLVSSISKGSHKDMNILTFMVSSAAISSGFFLCAQAGRNHKEHITELLPILREIGIWSEKKLLESTKGVNTQRGILFAGGLLCGVAGYLSKSNQITKDQIFEAIAEMTKGIVEKELGGLHFGKVNLTAGEKLYLKYQATGIRGEVEGGFPSVRDNGLPAFKEAIESGINLNYCLVHTLISLMVTAQDTTILWRKNKEELIKVQEMAKNVLDNGSVFTKRGLKMIEELDKILIDRNISPGGSADLVAVTVGIYLLENKQFPVAIL